MASDFLQRVGGANFLQAALGGRECSGGFFDNKGTNLDVSTVCHEVRNLDLAPGEQAYVSVRDLRRREGEAFAQMNTVCNLRTLELDTTLLLRIWVDEVSGGKPSSGERRVVGEVRIPLRRLIQIYDACLYHTWLTLESPGLHDSVASLGFMSGDEGSAFDQAITDGPKQLLQPKACISVCRSSDIGPSGKVMWLPDAAPEARAVGWGPLLRSQQQHCVLSTMLHQKCDRQASQLESSSTSEQQPSKPSRELEDRARSQEEEIHRLQTQLNSAQSQLQEQRLQLQQAQQAQQHAHQHQQPAGSLFRTQQNVPCMQDDPPSTVRRDQAGYQSHAMGGLSITQGGPSPYSQEGQAQLQAQSRRLADAEAALADVEAREHKAQERLRVSANEAEEYRLECERLREDATNGQQELEKISSEANGKIEAANDRIRTLRQRRDEAEQELQQLKSTTIPLLNEEKATLESENRQLSEQKEALLRIVEDLHQTCIAAGLNTAGRQSIDKTLTSCSITHEFRLT